MDAFARWFALLRELGEVLDVKLRHFDSPSGAPLREWIFPHEECDGARMVERALGDLGLTLASLPQIRESNPPPVFERLRAVWREIREGRQAPVPWRQFEPKARGSAEPPFAYALFEPDEVKAIARRAEAVGARSNSFLLWGLDRAVYGDVANRSHVHRWAVPVNLRGALRGAERIGNVASAISVRINDDAKPADVKKAIRDQLERNAHWGVWDAFRLLGYLGGWSMRRYATRYCARDDHSWVGTFSNLGPFDLDAGWICGTPPVTRSHPISAAAINVGGRLSLAIQIHPALGPLDLERVMRRWRGYIEGTEA